MHCQYWKPKEEKDIIMAKVWFCFWLPCLFVSSMSFILTSKTVSYVLHKFLEMAYCRAEFSPFPSRCLLFSLFICLQVFYLVLRKLLSRWVLHFGHIRLNSNGLQSKLFGTLHLPYHNIITFVQIIMHNNKQHHILDRDVDLE